MADIMHSGRHRRKARLPEVVMIPSGIEPGSAVSKLIREGYEGAGFGLSMEPRSGLLPVYPDRRVMPRTCGRTEMRRVNCCCAPCRALRRRKHGAACSCWLCYADRMGAWVDRLAEHTKPRRWCLFITQTFRTPTYPWARGFPVEQPEPNPVFVRHFIGRMIRFLEGQLRERIEFFYADQYGERGGRLHQHVGFSSPVLLQAARELSSMRQADPQTKRLPDLLNPLAVMLWKQAGFNRILPWETDAGYYIGRYIGRDAARCHWDFRVGPEPVRRIPAVGRQVVVESRVPDDSSDAYRQALSGWHR